jgi:hypothetical protein
MAWILAVTWADVLTISASEPVSRGGIAAGPVGAASGEAGDPVGEGDVEYNGVAEARRTWAADNVKINSTAEQALQITPGHWLAIGGGAHRPGHRRAK